MLDPSTCDVTGRALELLGLSASRVHTTLSGGPAFCAEQSRAGWRVYGRWGVNYIYGTCHVCVGLRSVNEPMHQPYIRRAVRARVPPKPDGAGGDVSFLRRPLPARERH